jgi:hypothetical protein
LSEQTQGGSSKNRSKWLIINNLQQKMDVVKKRQFEKQSQFGVTPAVLAAMKPSPGTQPFPTLTQA